MKRRVDLHWVAYGGSCGLDLLSRDKSRPIPISSLYRPSENLYLLYLFIPPLGLILLLGEPTRLC
jgi:hypothetical protein